MRGSYKHRSLRELEPRTFLYLRQIRKSVSELVIRVIKQTEVIVKCRFRIDLSKEYEHLKLISPIPIASNVAFVTHFVRSKTTSSLGDARSRSFHLLVSYSSDNMCLSNMVLNNK